MSKYYTTKPQLLVCYPTRLSNIPAPRGIQHSNVLDPPPYLLCRFALLCYSTLIACLLSPPYLLCLFYFALLFHPCLNRTPLPIVPRPAGTQLGVMNRRMDVLRGERRESGEKCKFIVCLTGAMCISGACQTGCAYRGWHTCGYHVCMGNSHSLPLHMHVLNSHWPLDLGQFQRSACCLNSPYRDYFHQQLTAKIHHYQ